MNNPDNALRLATSTIFGAEGFAAVAFLDKLAKPPVWTIGHGTTLIEGKPITEGMTCTEQQADAWAADDMRSAARYVLRVVKVPLNDFQLAALISLCYNIGQGNFGRSSVKDALDLHLYEVAANRFLQYDMAGGRKISGLDNRRIRERALFLTVPNETDLLNQAQLDKLGDQS
jgi:lysozyme